MNATVKATTHRAFSAYQLIYRYRSVALSAALAETRARNAGTVLGLGWALMAPLILLLVYTFVYGFIFKIRIPGKTLMDYMLHMFSGLSPFLFFSEAISLGTGALVNNKSLLKVTVFPLELVPLKAASSAVASFLVSLALLTFFSLASGRLGLGFLLLPVLVVSQAMFVLGVIWITAPVNLILRDTQNIIGYLMMVAMLVSPVSYSIDMVPEALRTLVYLNPFAHFIIAYQEVYESGTMVSPGRLLAILLISNVVFIAGYRFFAKTKSFVANYA